ncbi:MAG: phage tail tip lysozyme [Eubacteriales bacterium]|nr:phage tail tip lysozyme [Eubacteriales bacterium]
MSIKTIFNALRAAGMTEAGALGTMGNMGGESAMRANNAQDSYGLDDDAYTMQTDNGINNFTGDRIGYGLCQWTSPDRKAKLLAFAKSQGVSIADEAMQVQFCIREMWDDFPNVWTVVTTSDDVYRCTDVVCRSYEFPAKNNVGERFQFAMRYKDQLSGGEPPQVSTGGTTPAPVAAHKSDLAVKFLQTLMQNDGYWDGSIDGLKTDSFRKALVVYAKDVASC